MPMGVIINLAAIVISFIQMTFAAFTATLFTFSVCHLWVPPDFWILYSFVLRFFCEASQSRVSLRPLWYFHMFQAFS
jgi:hypothetical protein